MIQTAVYGNIWQDHSLREISDFLHLLIGSGMKVWVHAEFFDYLEGHDVRGPWHRVKEIPEGVSNVVSLGGDGTFLHAAQWTHDRGIPIMGINTGHLGFLASYSFHDSEEILEALQGKDVRVEPRMLLKVESPDLPADFWPYALNEVAIMKSETASMLTTRTWVNDHYLADYMADGLLVATPTGSTAYNLSVGGPVLQPTVSNMVLSPIAPHSLMMRPLVIGGDSLVEASVMCKARKCRVSLDGRTFKMKCAAPESSPRPTLRISKAPFCVNILRRRNSSFADILRHKLLWGEQNRK